MNRNRLNLGIFALVLVWMLALAGCSERATGVDTEAQVYGISDDGRALVGYMRAQPGVETGRVSIPRDSVWSMAGSGDAGLVWVHGPTETLLVDAKRWQVLNRWTRVGAPDAPMVARR